MQALGFRGIHLVQMGFLNGKIAQQGFQQVLAVQFRQALIQPVGADVQPQGGADCGHGTQVAIVPVGQPVQQAAAAE